MKSLGIKMLLVFSLLNPIASFAFGGGSTTVIEQELHIDTENQEIILQISIIGNLGNPISEIAGHMQTQQIIDISLLPPGNYAVLVQTSNNGSFSNMIYYHIAME
ncbi:MAG: hypothetical protein IPK03_06190 [Bacteroidetes bacterium]|nr:hypothetical protein [Bacteroidota bacterium]